MPSQTWRRLALVILGLATVVTLVARPATGAGLQGLTFTALPWFCAALGLFTAWRRDDDPAAWLLLALLISFGGIFGGQPPPPAWPVVPRVIAAAFDGLLNVGWPIAMLLFGVYLPDRARLDRRWPALKWLLIAPLGFLAGCTAAVRVGEAVSWDGVSALAAWLERTERYRMLVGMTAISGFFALLGEKAFTSPSADARRRIRLIFAGAFLGLTPLLVVVLLRMFGGWPDGALSGAMLVAASFLPIFPVTLAYVILVERAMDVGVVVRQGLQYALTRNAVRVVQALLSIGLMLTALALAAEPGANRPQRIMLLGIGVFLAVSLGQLTQRVLGFVDRRFFREALDTERLLQELGDDVRTIVDPDALLDVVARRLSEALHVPRVTAMLEEDGQLVLRQTQGAALPAIVLPIEGPLALRLRHEARPLVVYPGEARHWAALLPERTALLELEAQLLIPLLLKDRLLGMLALGAKRSEAAYAPSDLKLLQSVGSQVALALENGRLTATVAREAVRRERLNRELEIAREVQERLFPQELPVVQGLDYGGHCRPARGVGGDYYDFLALPEGRLGVAIGDISGKGIPAALLMASLQASLRGQATFGAIDLAELMARVNRLLCDSSSPNRYATFFYGEYDPRTGALDYVNAGHNAPMLLRSDGTVERLDQGGPVVGLIELAAYQAGRTELRPGDRLLAYTDGLSEAMNPQAEEWGEERMLLAYRSAATLSSAEANTKLVADADAFAAGAPQHDDMTVVTLHVGAPN